MARVQTASGRREQALQTLSFAVKRAPQSADAHFALGELLEEVGRKDEAEASFAKASKLAPDDPRSPFRLGRIADSRSHGDVAMERYREALAADPGYLPAAHYLSTELAKASRFDEAVATLEAALERVPENASMRCNLGHILLKSGDAARAATE